MEALQNFSCNKVTKKKGEVITSEDLEIIGEHREELEQAGLARFNDTCTQSTPNHNHSFPIGGEAVKTQEELEAEAEAKELAELEELERLEQEEKEAKEKAEADAKAIEDAKNTKK